MKNKKWFNYVIVFVVLFIPLIYSFFYLKAYWNPYGEGNIDNLRSEEHTSELQSRFDLVCRLLLEKKNILLQ